VFADCSFLSSGAQIATYFVGDKDFLGRQLQKPARILRLDTYAMVKVLEKLYEVSE